MNQKVKKIVVLAGEIIQEGFGNPNSIKTKSNEKDFVTEYDQRVEDFLKERFQEEFPDLYFIGEESDNLEEFINQKDLKNYFIVDPIDGTTNFIKGFPYVSISVAVYKDNKPYYGIVYNPIMNELYEAISGTKQSFLNGKEIKVSKKEKKSLLGGINLNKDKKNRQKEDFEILEKLSKEYLDIRKLSSTALEMCYVAKGVFGIYATNKIKAWDIAAAKIIIEEAGGVVQDIYGNKINILNVENVKATF